MHELIEYLEKFPLAVQVITYVVGWLVGIQAIVKFLGAIKDKTTTTYDDKAYIILDKLQNAIGWLAAYRKKDPK